MTKSKKILVWGGEGILSTSIEFFLTLREGWQVIKVSNQENLDYLDLAVESVQPDIVIVHHTCHQSAARIALQLLQNYSGIKVITLSLENNAMEVYTKREVMIEQSSDLISMIENGS